MKKILLALLLALLAASGVHAEELPAMYDSAVIAYHAYKSEITPIGTQSVNDGAALPGNLIIPPGRYRVFGQTYALDQEGLYRFFNQGTVQTQQRIVYRVDPIAIISGAQWIIVQSYAHNGLSYAQMTEVAKTNKLLVSCQPGVFWLSYLLNSVGIPARPFSAITAQAYNNYSDGHSVLEVQLDGQWALFDTGYNVRFHRNSEPLSGLGLTQMADSGDYELEKMSLDTFFDVSGTVYQGGSGFAFYEPLTQESFLREMYARLFDIPLVYEAGAWWYYDPRQQASFQSWGFRQISESDWLQRFYPSGGSP